MATCRYVKVQKPPEHTSEHVKSQNFLGACPQIPITQSILWAPLFVFALDPYHPVSGPVSNSQSGIEQDVDDIMDVYVLYLV